MNSPYDPPPLNIDHAALAEYNAGILFSRLAYDSEKPAGQHEGIDYEARIAASEKQLRYRARKKEKSK